MLAYSGRISPSKITPFEALPSFFLFGAHYANCPLSIRIALPRCDLFVLGSVTPPSQQIVIHCPKNTCEISGHVGKHFPKQHVSIHIPPQHHATPSSWTSHLSNLLDLPMFLRGIPPPLTVEKMDMLPNISIISIRNTLQ